MGLGEEDFIFGFDGSKAVPACPSCRDKGFDFHYY
jgi:hypothetical protein